LFKAHGGDVGGYCFERGCTKFLAQGRHADVSFFTYECEQALLRRYTDNAKAAIARERDLGNLAVCLVACEDGDAACELECDRQHKEEVTGMATLKKTEEGFSGDAYATAMILGYAILLILLVTLAGCWWMDRRRVASSVAGMQRNRKGQKKGLKGVAATPATPALEVMNSFLAVGLRPFLDVPNWSKHKGPLDLGDGFLLQVLSGEFYASPAIQKMVPAEPAKRERGDAAPYIYAFLIDLEYRGRERVQVCISAPNPLGFGPKVSKTVAIDGFELVLKMYVEISPALGYAAWRFTERPEFDVDLPNSWLDPAIESLLESCLSSSVLVSPVRFTGMMEQFDEERYKRLQQSALDTLDPRLDTKNLVTKSIKPVAGHVTYALDATSDSFKSLGKGIAGSLGSLGNLAALSEGPRAQAK